MEAFDITGDIEPININLNVDKPTNFGTGIELLMNDKNKSSSTMKVDLGDLDKLENDLNDFVWFGNFKSACFFFYRFQMFSRHMRFHKIE